MMLQHVTPRHDIICAMPTLFKPESQYNYSAHKYRSSPWLQIYDARHMKIDTTEYLVNRDKFHRLYQSLKHENISHQDILMMVGNPYAETIRRWKYIPEARRQIIRKEYPEMEVTTAAYLKWEAEHVRISNIKEGIDDCFADFVSFVTNVKSFQLGYKAWQAFKARKIVTTILNNAPKLEKVANKLPSTKKYYEKVKPEDELKKLKDKYNDLEKARKTAVRTETLPDGRIRYYAKENPASTSGKMRGAGMVTEYNPKTNDVRQWMETRDHLGNVKIVHPKMINGVRVNVPHYPHINKDMLEFGVKK